MPRDITALLDHLGLDRGDLLACSLGAQIGLRVLEVEHRVRRAVLGGIGDAVLDWDEGAAIALAEVLKGDEPTLDKGGRALRARRRPPRALPLRSCYLVAWPLRQLRPLLVDGGGSRARYKRAARPRLRGPGPARRLDTRSHNVWPSQFF